MGARYTHTLAAGTPYCDGVLIAIPFSSARPQLCRTLAIVNAPISSTSPNKSVSMMIGWADLVVFAANARLFESRNAAGTANRILGGLVHRRKIASTEIRGRIVFYTSLANVIRGLEIQDLGLTC
jgi:hypothetical protein